MNYDAKVQKRFHKYQILGILFAEFNTIYRQKLRFI